jgi:ribosome-associated translation inhibitor RaiA
MNIPYEIQDYISMNLERKLEELFEDQTIETRTNLYIDQEKDRASLSIEINIGTKFYEISEVLASKFGEYCNEKGLTDEECEERFHKAYNEKLKRINEEYSIPVEGKITIKLNENSEAEIEVYPLECNGDYCITGLGVHIYTQKITIDFLEMRKDVLIEAITKFIDSIYDLYVSL